MNKQQSNSRGEKSSVEKAESTRYGFEPIPATAKVDGRSLRQSNNPPKVVAT